MSLMIQLEEDQNLKNCEMQDRASQCSLSIVLI